MLKRALLLTAGLLLLLPLYAAFAQDDGGGTPTPSATPEAGVIARSGVELVFPVELQFFLIISVPPQSITNGEVVLSQDSGFVQSFPLDMTDDLNYADEESLEIRKTILFDQDNAPRPFERLDYEWRITSSQGTDSLNDWILFQPEGDWQQTPADALKVYWGDSSLNADVLREDLLPLVDLIESHTGSVADLDFAIYPTNFDICVPNPDTPIGEGPITDLVYPGRPQYRCSLNDVAEYYTAHGIMLVQPQEAGLDTLQSPMVAALVNDAYSARWAGRDVPAWFASGLTAYYGQSNSEAALATVRSAEAQDFLLPPARLENALPANAEAFEARLWDAQSYSLVLYLADNFGANAPFDLATAFPEAESFEIALQDLTGMSFAENLRLWRQWLR